MPYDVPAANTFLSIVGLNAAAVGDHRSAAEAYEQLEPIADKMAGSPWNPLPVTHFVLGRLSEFLGHRETCIDHFVESRRLHEEYGASALVALSERALAELS